MKIELLHTDGCVGIEASRVVLAAVLGELAPGTEVTEVLVVTEEQAREVRFQGSPSIRVQGMDLEGRSPEPTGLT